MAGARRRATIARMEVSSTSSAAQATEIQQTVLLKKGINAEQMQVLTLIQSAVQPTPDVSPDSLPTGRMLDAKA